MDGPTFRPRVHPPTAQRFNHRPARRPDPPAAHLDGSMHGPVDDPARSTTNAGNAVNASNACITGIACFTCTRLGRSARVPGRPPTRKLPDGYRTAAAASDCEAYSPYLFAAVLRSLRPGTKPTNPYAGSGAGTRQESDRRFAYFLTDSRHPPPYGLLVMVPDPLEESRQQQKNNGGGRSGWLATASPTPTKEKPS